jgi:hypothetical protein
VSFEHAIGTRKLIAKNIKMNPRFTFGILQLLESKSIGNLRTRVITIVLGNSRAYGVCDPC